MILTLLLIGAQLVIPNHSVGQRVDAFALFSVYTQNECWKVPPLQGCCTGPAIKKAIIGGLCSIKGHIWEFCPKRLWALSVTQHKDIASALVTQAALMFYIQLRFHFCHICKIVNPPAEAEQKSGLAHLLCICSTPAKSKPYCMIDWQKLVEHTNSLPDAQHTSQLTEMHTHVLTQSILHTQGSWYVKHHVSVFSNVDTVSENTISRSWALHSSKRGFCAGLAWQSAKLKATWNIWIRCQ